MRILCSIVVALLLTGCQPSARSSSEPSLPEPADFAHWPRVTEKPIEVAPHLWALCSVSTAHKEAAKVHGPHIAPAIVVRVSSGAKAAFLSGKPLPTGAVVVKEKHANRSAAGPLDGYAVMVKRSAGYYPEGGDWEYAFVALNPERRVTQGRLTACASCHASARSTDYLFRSYKAASR